VRHAVIAIIDNPAVFPLIAVWSFLAGLLVALGPSAAMIGVVSSVGLAVATAIAVGVAAALVIMLVWLGLSLTGRTTRREEAHQRDQSDLRDLLQSSESEEESRALLIRHLVKMFPGARAAVFNRNNSDDRLEVTRDATGEAIPAGSPLAAANAEQLRPRSCMAVRLSRPYDQRPGDDLVLLIGAADLRASKRFYVEHGLSVKRSFPGRYAEFDAPPGGIKLALYPGRAGLAKDAGVSPDGDGPHGIAVNSSTGQFTDPDGFSWEAA